MEIQQAIEVARTAVAEVQEFRSETYFAILLAKLLDPAASTAAPNTSESQPATSVKPYSAPEFFAARRWETDNDKVALSGYFLERHSGLANYGAQEIKDCLMSAKVAPPANVNVAILRCIGRGWMMEIPTKNGGKKLWALTQAGERYAESLNKQDD